MKKAIVENGVLKLTGDWSELANLIKEKTGIEQNFMSVQFTSNPFPAITLTKNGPIQEKPIEKYKFMRVNQNFKMEIDPFLAKYLAIIFGKEVCDETKKEEPILLKFREKGKEESFMISFASKTTEESEAKYGYLTISKSPGINEEDVFPLLMKQLDPTRRLIRYKYLCSCLEYPPSPDKLPLPYEEEELHYEYFDKTKDFDISRIPLSASFSEIGSFLVAVPIAIHIIEIFAINQLDREKCNVNKDFLKFKKVYLLEIPFKIPVLFTVVNGGTMLSFKEHCGISVEEQSKYMQTIIKRFQSKAQHISTFQNVIPGKIKSETLIEKENELGFCFIKDAETPYDKKSVQFGMYMISNEVGQKEKEQVQKFKDFSFDLYKQCAIYTCEVCGYKSTDNNPCPPYQHLGARIPFPDGEMSKYIYVGGIKTEQRKYTCCGVVNVEFDEGCSKESHHTYPISPENVNSIFNFQ